MTATTIDTPTPESEKLPTWRKIGYGVGDIFGGGSSTILGFYYLIFLTDVVRINPALAGTVILISKVYDSITDPFEGVLSDRTRTRWGRRRPYFIAGIPLIFLSFFALFYPVNFDEELHRFIFVILTYLFFSTVVSIVMLNYNALQPEMTLDYNERTSLSSVRILFSTLASIVCALVPIELVKAFPDVRQGYIVMGLVFGIFFAVPFIFTTIAARERKEFQKPPEKFNLRDTFVEPFRVRTFVIILLAYMFAFIAVDSVGSIVVYFTKYHLLRGDEANYIAGTMLVFNVVSLPIYSWISRRTSKRTALVIAMSVWMVVMLGSLLIKADSPFLAPYIFAAMAGLGIGGVYVMVYAIFPDIPDVDELRTGERREGIFGAMITLFRKFSSAIGIFLVANMLAITGYVKPVEQIVDGASRLIDQPQSDEFILVLRLIFAVMPIVFVFIALLFVWRYPLSGEVHARLNSLLSKRRLGEPETEEMEAEAEELSKILI